MKWGKLGTKYFSCKDEARCLVQILEVHKKFPMEMSRFILGSIQCCLKLNAELLHLKEAFGIIFRINIYLFKQNFHLISIINMKVYITNYRILHHNKHHSNSTKFQP